MTFTHFAQTSRVGPSTLRPCRARKPHKDGIQESLNRGILRGDHGVDSRSNSELASQMRGPRSPAPAARAMWTTASGSCSGIAASVCSPPNSAAVTRNNPLHEPSHRPESGLNKPDQTTIFCISSVLQRLERIYYTCSRCVYFLFTQQWIKYLWSTLANLRE